MPRSPDSGRGRPGRGARERRRLDDAYARKVVEGRVIAHRDGYGFLVCDEEGEDDAFLPPREMRGLMHGDRIVCEVRTRAPRRGGRAAGATAERPGRQGTVLEILERGANRVVGRLYRAGDLLLLSPEGPNAGQEIVIREGKGAAGEIAVAELLGKPSVADFAPAGRIVERLGDPEEPSLAIEIALRAWDIPYEWPEDVLKEAARVPVAVGNGKAGEASCPEGRHDLRPLPLVTIDGPDAKDFDDAVHCEPRARGGGWKLTVAIADVSHYVTPGSALDREAALRGTSVYFPGRVVPMLPEALSNGICSLNPEVDRLCLACEMHIDAEGRVTRSYFRDAIMRSRARLTYEEVEAAVFERDAKTRKRLGSLTARLDALREVYEALHAARVRRGAIDLDLGASRVVLDRRGAVSHFEPEPRLGAHRLIEECMVTANVAAAHRLARLRAPFLYRAHPPPDETAIPELRAALGRFGFDFDPGPDLASLAPGVLQEVAERAASRPESELLHMLILRAMSQACYQPEHLGHFGLALDHYTHFTSPIRRYPDLLVHRALRGEMAGCPPGEMAALGRSTSMTERRAEDATRDAVARLVCQYFEARIGDVFRGRVTGVASFGLFVRLEGTQADGVVGVRDLGGDWYRYDRAAGLLEGESTGRRFALGNEMEVRIARVDTDERRIRLVPVGMEETAFGGGRRGRRGRDDGYAAVPRRSGRGGGDGRRGGRGGGGKRFRGRG